MTEEDIVRNKAQNRPDSKRHSNSMNENYTRRQPKYCSYWRQTSVHSTEPSHDEL